MMAEEQRIYINEQVDQILEQRARILASTPEKEVEKDEILHLLTFSLGQDRFGVEASFVREAQPLARFMWSPVPCTPDFILGAVNIRGRIYSIMHISSFMGIKSEPPTPDAHILIIMDEDICLLTDNRPVAEKVVVKSIQESSGASDIGTNEYIIGVTPDMLAILDLGRLLSDPGIIVHNEL
jgi:purine-binding chemotaxis protein CheW